MKKIFLIALTTAAVITCLGWLALSGTDGNKKSVKPVSTISVNDKISEGLLKRIKTKAAEARRYAEQKKMNSDLSFLIDMNQPSGLPRFFVYHFKKDSIVNSGLVTHGRCNENWLEGRKYSNVPGSGCTSLGRYRIGYSYHGQFGLAYKLYGLDNTNDKAFERFVVLHSHECVPESASEEEICQSDGCPTVSPGFLQYLKPIIDRSARPVLLWVFD